MNLREINLELTELDPTNKVKLGVTGPSLFRPGDIISFNYRSIKKNIVSSRLGLVVSSSRAKNGKRVSSKNNLIVNVIDISSNLASFIPIYENFYKNIKNSSYETNKSALSSIFGLDRFRTFAVKNILQPRALVIYKAKK